MKYDIVLKEKVNLRGLAKDEVIDLYEKLNGTEAYPLETYAREHECSAMGFISKEAAEILEYDYEYPHSEFCSFIANILDNLNCESDDCTYEFQGLKIWLSR